MKSYEHCTNILTTYIKENQQKFYKLAFSYVKNEDIALDIIQDAIVKALSKIHTLKNEQYVTTWFYRIFINQCLTTIKKTKSKEEFTLEDFTINYEDSYCTDTLDMFNHINQLKPKLKTVILLRFFEDKKLEEIVQITNTNLSTVKSRLYKGLKELKNIMMEENKNEKYKEI